MPCPTCGGTLALVMPCEALERPGANCWHCSRCGTHVIKSDGSPDHITEPSLVRRARELLAYLTNNEARGPRYTGLLRNLEEACRAPEEHKY